MCAKTPSSLITGIPSWKNTKGRVCMKHCMEQWAVLKLKLPHLILNKHKNRLTLALSMMQQLCKYTLPTIDSMGIQSHSTSSFLHILIPHISYKDKSVYQGVFINWETWASSTSWRTALTPILIFVWNICPVYHHHGRKRRIGKAVARTSGCLGFGYRLQKLSDVPWSKAATPAVDKHLELCRLLTTGLPMQPKACHVPTVNTAQAAFTGSDSALVDNIKAFQPSGF